MLVTYDYASIPEDAESNVVCSSRQQPAPVLISSGGQSAHGQPSNTKHEGPDDLRAFFMPDVHHRFNPGPGPSRCLGRRTGLSTASRSSMKGVSAMRLT